jgi:hypothetical protein
LRGKRHIAPIRADEGAEAATIRLGCAAGHVRALGSGVFAILEYERTPDGTVITIGTGTFAISVLAGALNAFAGAILWSRAPNRR